MTYNAMIELAGSSSLSQRIAAAAAGERIDSPDAWASVRRWEFAAQPGWVDAWDYAKASLTINMNKDLGERDDVITDAMILSAVQALNV